VDAVALTSSAGRGCDAVIPLTARGKGSRPGAHQRRCNLRRHEETRRAQPWLEAWIDGIEAGRRR